MTLITGTTASAAGAATLVTLRDRVEQTLHDTGNTTWSTAELDEAIRHAIDEYTQVAPHRAITTLTLAASGREIDISGIANLITVSRVWWEYTAANPEYPPQWREFEQWAGGILRIDAGREPQTGDVVRIFYTGRHTLTDLDGASVTTIPDEHISLIVTGAAGHAACSHALSLAPLANVDGWVHKRFNEWGASKLDQFRALLARVAARRAAQNAGIAPGYPLDRWDNAHN